MEFPFLFPFPKNGNDIFIPNPVPKSWECNLSFPFPKFGNGLSPSRSCSQMSKSHSRSPLGVPPLCRWTSTTSGTTTKKSWGWRRQSFIFYLVTELMKSKELSCANYHPNELWLAKGGSKCTMCKTGTNWTLALRYNVNQCSNVIWFNVMQINVQSRNLIHFDESMWFSRHWSYFWQLRTTIITLN